MKHAIGILLLLSLTSCITILPSHQIHDSYEDRMEFSRTEIEFIEIDTTLNAISQYDTIYLFATWCSGCIVHLSDYNGKKNDATALVSVNYDVEILERKFPENLDTVFILSHKSYGGTEKNKIIKFTTLLKTVSTNITGMPQIFIRTGNGFKRGEIEKLNDNTMRIGF